MAEAKTRRCPFYGCKKMIDGDYYACRVHWPTLNDEDRFTLMRIWNEYREGKLHIDDFTCQQAMIQLKNTPQAVPGASIAKDHTDSEIELAKKVKQYIAKRKEYTNCNIGFADRKKKLGMELGRIETELGKMAHAILHPAQEQPTLFDNPADEAQQQMPD
jgi:hypothetical protein